MQDLWLGNWGSNGDKRLYLWCVWGQTTGMCDWQPMCYCYMGNSSESVISKYFLPFPEESTTEDTSWLVYKTGATLYYPLSCTDNIPFKAFIPGTVWPAFFDFVSLILRK